MSGPVASRLRNPRVVWTSGATALVLVLGGVEKQLDVFNLRPLILALLTFLLAVGAVALGTLSERQAQATLRAQLDETLDDALACWPTRQARELSPYDMGARPTLAVGGAADRYLPRTKLDDRLSRALADSHIVVAFGPAGSGATRAAFKAVCDWRKDAVMLVPEHAEGLRAMLKHAADLDIAGQPAVVWLDDLDRYVAGLDIDPLEQLLQRRGRRGLLARLRGRPASPAPATRLVATIHDDALDRLLHGEERSYPARRLLTQASGIVVPGELDDDERTRYRERFGNDPPGSTVADAFDASWRDGWLRCPPREPQRAARSWRPTINGTSAALGLLVLAIAVTLGVEIHRLGWTVPASVADQVAALTGKETCPADAYPRKGAGLEQAGSGTAATLVVLVHGADCGRSDVLRFFRLRHGRLKPVLMLAPPPGGAPQAFECLGPRRSDPCHVRIQGRATYIAGAFRDAESRQELPVALSFDHGFRAWALSLPAVAARRAPRLVHDLAGRRSTVALAVDGQRPASDDACVPSSGCLRGRRAQGTAVVPRGAEPAVLLAAYTASGTTQVPRRMRLEVWHLTVVGGRPKVDRSCVVLRNGRRVSTTLGGDDSPLSLHRLWRPKGSELMC